MSARDELLLDIKDLKTYFFTAEGVVKAVDGVSFIGFNLFGDGLRDALDVKVGEY